MILQPGIRKGNGLDEIVASYQLQLPDEPKQLQAQPSYLRTLLDRFEQVFDPDTLFHLNPDVFEMDKYFSTSVHDPSFLGSESHIKAIQRILQKQTTILAPAEIDTFLAATNIYHDKRGYDVVASTFINHFLQQSFNAGDNQFILTTDHYMPRDLCRNLQGLPERYFEITIIGPPGFDFAEKCHYVSIEISTHSLENIYFRNSTHCVIWPKSGLNLFSREPPFGNTIITEDKSVYIYFQNSVPPYRKNGHKRLPITVLYRPADGPEEVVSV